MKRLALALLAAGLALAGVGNARAQILDGILRQGAPLILGGSKQKNKEDAQQSTLGTDLLLGVGALGISAAVAGAVAKSTSIAVRQRGTVQGEQALSAIRSYMIGATATAAVGRYVQWNVGNMVRAEPGLRSAGVGVLADLGLDTAVLDSNNASVTVTLPASASKATWAELLSNCRNQPQRLMAQAQAYQWAGVSALSFADFAQIPWRNFIFPSGLSKNSRPFGEFRGRYPNDNFYELSSSNGAYVREHPLGHPDQPGLAHHDCPHFHAMNRFKQEQIYPYLPQ